MKLQKVVLGNRELGTVEIYSEGTTWQETLDKRTSKERLYLKLDVENMKLVDRFYADVKDGDMVEGVYNTTPYYEILGVEIVGELFTERLSLEALDEDYFGWTVYNGLLPENTKFIISIR